MSARSVLVVSGVAGLLAGGLLTGCSDSAAHVACPAGSARTIQVCGAVNARLAGTFTCFGTQVSGLFHVDGRTLSINVGDVVAATLSHPPGGAPAWIFMSTTDPSDRSGVRTDGKRVAMHTTIPYDDLLHLSSGRPPRSGLRLDGQLPCQ